MITPRQLCAARALLGNTQSEFAAAVGLAKSTYVSYEVGLPLSPKSLEKIERYLYQNNVVFYRGGVILKEG